MTIGERIRQIIRVLPFAIVLWLGSHMIFGFITRKAPFWYSKETWAELAWNGAIFVPVMILILIFAVKKNQSEDNK